MKHSVVKNLTYKPSTKQHRQARWAQIKDSYAWQPGINYRDQPELYKVGKGEQGVLICEPYKSEIGQHWRFKNPEVAHDSSQKIMQMFSDYLCSNDFVGADMARKYLQMGYTRSRRYANHESGRKYNATTGQELPRQSTSDLKAQSAQIFYTVWQDAESNAQYKKMKVDWKAKFG